VLWTRVNVGEATPGVVTPLTADFQRPANTWPAARMFHRMGLLPHPRIPGHDTERTATTRFFCGQIAISVDFLRWLADRTPGTSGDAFEASILGRVRPGQTSTPDRSRYLLAAAKLAWLIKVLPGENARLHRETRDWWTARTKAAAGAGLGEARALFLEARQRYERIIDHAGLVAILSPAALDQIAKPLKRMGQEDALLVAASGYAAIKETDMLEKLWAVAKRRMRLSLFLDEFGYMCPAGGELETLSWREDPEALAPLMEAYAGAPRSESPRAKHAAALAAGEAKRHELLSRAKAAGTETGLKFGFWLAARFTPLRETGKACMFMGCDVARAAARRMGRLLADRGVLEAADDVFYLTLADLERAETLTREVRSAVEQRKTFRAFYQRFELPDFFTSEELGAIIAAGAAEPAAPTAPTAPGGSSARRAPVEGFTLTGAPASAGVVTGRARVVLDPRRVAGFARGDILVCRVTDPGWTTLITLAGAMVVDIGGMLSHAAIIAREIGAPAVVNTRDGTKRIPDGAIVTVDGAAGTVMVHDETVEALRAAG
jgi:pyruvate,water dikinase